MTLKPGSQLGPYEVVALLGAGGMGEVYRARDPRLDRDVAIKVLLEEITDADHLRRFEQEARAAGALNHPNVLAVYDIGTHGGVPYVVSELLEGRTLRASLAGGALPVRQAVDHALQITHGLAAAHESGIVHRDLKPENVFVTGEGRVKLLDLGLAKLKRPSEEATAGGEDPTVSWKTDPGTLLGTAGYMSPEQVRGQDVDHRSDIFSLGAVLYEMLSGHRAFRRESPVETMQAILNEDPPPLSGPAGGPPPALERIVQRCLEKRPADRFHSTHDLVLALEAVSSGVSSSRRLPPGLEGRRRWIEAGVVAALAAVAGITGLLFLRARESNVPPLRVRPLTATPGVAGLEWHPALSPDGRLVAFMTAGEPGEVALCVKQVDGGGDPLVIASGKGGAFTPAWSPDGQRIAFIRHVEGDDGIPDDQVTVVSALGGAARPLATIRGSHGLSWSPDGRILAVAHKEARDGPASLHLLSIDDGGLRKLTSPPATFDGDSHPSFSPDGRTLAFVREEAPWETDVYVVSVAGGDERRLTEGNSQTEGLAWSADGQSLVFSAWRRGGIGEFCLWRVPASGGEPEPLWFGENGKYPSVSGAGHRLAYMKQRSSWNIWRAGRQPVAESERAAKPLIASSFADLHPRYSPDGEQIAFASDRSGALEIWVCESDGASPRQLTFLDSAMAGNPVWSPDGKTIAFFSSSEGSWDVWTVSASGGPPRRLTTGPERDFVSSWSRDGRWVYFFSKRSGRFEAWKVPARGGEAVQVTTRGGTGAIESPDGRFVYFNKSDLGGPPGIWRMPREGGPQVQVLEWGLPLSWAVLEEGILHLNQGNTPPTIELFHFDTEEVSLVTEVANVTGPGVSGSPDGRWVLYVGGEEIETDIMLVEGFR